jgi:hypothetical protein
MHREISSIVLPNAQKTTYSEEFAALLGGQQRPTRDTNCGHQIMVQRILHQIKLPEAREFTRALIMTPLIDAASANT